MPSDFYNAVEAIKTRRKQKLEQEVFVPFLQGMQVLKQSRIKKESETKFLEAKNIQGRQHFGADWEDYTPDIFDKFDYKGIQADYEGKVEQHETDLKLMESGITPTEGMPTSEKLELLATDKYEKSLVKENKILEKMKYKLGIESGIDTTDMTPEEVRIKYRDLIAEKPEVEKEDEMADMIEYLQKNEVPTEGLTDQQITDKYDEMHTLLGQAKIKQKKEEYNKKLDKIDSLEGQVKYFEEKLEKRKKEYLKASTVGTRLGLQDKAKYTPDELNKMLQDKTVVLKKKGKEEDKKYSEVQKMLKDAKGELTVLQKKLDISEPELIPDKKTWRSDEIYTVKSPEDKEYTGTEHEIYEQYKADNIDKFKGKKGIAFRNSFGKWFYEATRTKKAVGTETKTDWWNESK